MSRRRVYVLVAAVCALPRLAILLHERGAITGSFTEKSDIFAQMFVKTGTFGMVPGEPSAYTQPLYAWFLIPVYWLLGRSWESIGIAQLILAIATAWLVYEIGCRLTGRRAGLIAAAIATLNPYVAWHDMHVNREIVDQVCAAALVLLTLMVAERRSRRLATLLGLVTGVAMLGNTRLVFVPILCAAYLVWRLPRTRVAVSVGVLIVGGAAVAVTPWLVRNKATVGCFTLTTDGRALWKANNPQTYGLLSSGQWIDNISSNSPRPPPPNNLTPEDAWGYYTKPGVGLRYARDHYPNECVEMTFYEHLATDYVHQHPGNKAKVAALSEQLLWQPNVFETTGRNGAGTSLDLGRRVIEPVYMWVLYALAAVGLLFAPRGFVALALFLFAYQSICAALFAGATRYRIAWDFLLAILAAAVLDRAVRRAGDQRRTGLVR